MGILACLKEQQKKKEARFTDSLVSFLRMCRILSVTLQEESERRHDGEAAANLQ